MIGRRLSRLAPETERVLAVAAVAGREFDLALLEAVLGAGRRARRARGGRRRADGPRGAGPPGRYAFAHALVRETLYDELSLTRRVRTHRALADALDTLPERRLAELAHHRLEAAAAGGGAAAADAALAAAREAMARARLRGRRGALRARAGRARGRRRRPAARELLLALGEARLRAGEPAREAFARGRRGSPARSATPSCWRARRSASAGSA